MPTARSATGDAASGERRSRSSAIATSAASCTASTNHNSACTSMRVASAALPNAASAVTRPDAVQASSYNACILGLTGR